MRKALYIIMLAMLSSTAYATTINLEWVTLPQPQNMAPNHSQTVTMVVRSNVPTSPIPINDVVLDPATNAVDIRSTNNCNGLIPPNGLCEITTNIFSHSTTGIVSEILNVNYGDRHINLSTPIQFNINGILPSQLSFTQQPTIEDMELNSTQNVVYTVQNSSVILPAKINASFFTPPSAVVQTSTSNDCNSIVPAGGTCNITLSIQSQSTSGVVDGVLIVDYNPSGATLTSDPIQFGVSGTFRLFTFNNECSFDVWIGLSGGSANSKIGTAEQPTICNSDDDCHEGSTCIQTGAIKQCFWNNPEPDNGTYKLSNGESNIVRIPEFNNGVEIIWSGGFAGRTNCTGITCETATCGNGDAECTPSVGFTPPATLAEFTLQRTMSDFYDITVINGINIPMEFQPANATVDPANPFTCGSSGNPATVNGLGGCSWVYTTPSDLYRHVPMGGANCASDATCVIPGEVCGLTLPAILAASTQTICGKFLGYWSANQICALNQNYVAPSFDCSQNAGMPIPYTTLTLTNLFQCVSPPGEVKIESCYTAGADSNCCGCRNWQDEGILMPGAPIVEQCDPPSNTSWKTSILPTLTWAKAACPTSYTYPFDDQASTFTCKVDSMGTNITNYNVTFCPGGAEGFPTPS